MSWEPQIRTNLDDEVYVRQLDELLSSVPDSLRAGLVNIRFGEACVRGPDGQTTSDEELDAIVALTTGLLGGDDHGLARRYAEAFAALGAIDAAYLNFREETLLLQRIAGDKMLLLTASASLNQGSCATLLRQASEQIAGGDHIGLSDVLEPNSEVLAGALVDLRSGDLVDRHERFRDASVLAIDERLGHVLRSFYAREGEPAGLQLKYRSGEPIEIRRAELVTEHRSTHWSRIQFDPEHLLVLTALRSAVRGLVWIMMRRSEIEVVRQWVDGLLRYGVPSTMSPFPATQREFLEIVESLRALPENDLLGRLDIGGFANYTVGQGDDTQRCQECIYYLPNGKWCDLPELPIPVEPHWWCRLWKI